MKRVIAIFAVALAVASCRHYETNYETTIVYKVHYPDTTVTKSYTYDSSDMPSYVLGSDRGSDYLYVYEDYHWPGYGQYRLENTNASIEIKSFTKKKKYEED